LLYSEHKASERIPELVELVDGCEVTAIVRPHRSWRPFGEIQQDARYSGRLASASLLGPRRRCHLARAAAFLASSLDFLQGTSEEIRFQRLVRQHPLQIAYLFAKPSYGRARRAIVSGFLLALPVIQHGSMYPHPPPAPRR